jgi:Glyoxalase-like domain
MKSCIVLMVAVAGTLAAQSTPSVIGNGWGLDHVIVALSNPEVVKDVFGAKLGFTPLVGTKFPADGLEQATIALPPAYIEFMCPYQEPTTNARPLASLVRKKVESGGGLVAYKVDVSPAEQAADAMRHLGLRVSLPPSPKRRTADGTEAPGAWQPVDIAHEDQAAQPLGVPGGAAVEFLEYRANSDHLKPERFQRALERAEREVPDARRVAGELHANTARKLLSVWIAVPNIADAVRQAGRFGFAAGGERHFKALGEKGQEVQCGQGTLIFFAPVHQNSPLAALVKKQGLGPFGISVEVGDLKTAQRIIQQGTHSKFGMQRTGKRMSFVVPVELAAGTFIEFVQQ